MPIEAQSRRQVPHRPALDLPPSFRLVTLREVGDAFRHAQAIAATEGAGTLVWVGRFDLVEFAVVLEPDEPLRTARCAHYAAMNALADALAAHAPPEKPIGIVWPDGLTVDGGLVGGGRLAWPAGTPETEPPPWLVFGAIIRTVAMGEDEPGLRPLAAALEEEGFDGLESGRLVESFARHLMLAVDTWQEQGFAALARDYVARLPRESGIRREIDQNGDLVLRRPTAPEPERRALVPALGAAAWFDPETGGPRR